MSGISGIFDRAGGAITGDDVVTVDATLAHRGPDGAGLWRDDRVGLGHQQFATTPEARFDEQPLVADDLVVTADARLDNRAELLAVLPVREPPERVPDSQLMAAAYRQWGLQCVDHLLGSFAFAIWDRQANQLFCARDRIGVKPLYYHVGEDAFAFASEPGALLALEAVPDGLDERRIGDFLTGRLEDERISFYASIERLPPAHAMIVTADGVDRWQYWDLDPTRTITLESDAAYEREFRRLLEQAVRCRLRGPSGVAGTDPERTRAGTSRSGTVATELSGGLDSSSITLLARELLPADVPLPTFSNVFESASSSDEREFIEPIAGRDGIVPEYVFLDERGVLTDRDRVFEFLDVPPHNTLHFGNWTLLNRAADAGVSVLLSGAVGDSATNYGLGLLPQWFRTGRWRALSRELTAMSELLRISRPWAFRHHVLAPLVPPPVKRRYRRLRGEPILETAANPTLADSFVDRIDLRERYRRLDTTSARIQSTDRLRQYHSLRSGRHAANLEVRDRLCAAVGIEPRYPFTDARLLEFSLAIPPAQQFADGYTRSIIRRSLDDLLPPIVQWRPWKTMLNEGFWNALEREDEHLRELIAESDRIDDYVDPDALAGAYDRFAQEPTSTDARALWRALSLSTWLEFADVRPSAGASLPLEPTK